MIREIKSCKDCPFSISFGEFDGSECPQMICREIARQGIEWKDKDGFDDMYHAERIPSVCPLRITSIIIKLDEKLVIR